MKSRSNIFSIDTRPFLRKTSITPKDDACHWNFNGESHYLIGKGMAEKMVNLLGP